MCLSFSIAYDMDVWRQSATEVNWLIVSRYCLAFDEWLFRQKQLFFMELQFPEYFSNMELAKGRGFREVIKKDLPSI